MREDSKVPKSRGECGSRLAARPCSLPSVTGSSGSLRPFTWRRCGCSFPQCDRPVKSGGSQPQEADHAAASPGAPPLLQSGRSPSLGSPRPARGPAWHVLSCVPHLVQPAAVPPAVAASGPGSFQHIPSCLSVSLLGLQGAPGSPGRFRSLSGGQRGKQRPAWVRWSLSVHVTACEFIETVLMPVQCRRCPCGCPLSFLKASSSVQGGLGLGICSLVSFVQTQRAREVTSTWLPHVPRRNWCPHWRTDLCV